MTRLCNYISPKFLFTISFVLLSTFSMISGAVEINGFQVKESLLKNDKIALIATDKNDQPLENINGTFLFSINGLKYELRFRDGVAIIPQPIEKSAFLYVKHKNEHHTYTGLYYVMKRGEDLNLYKISWTILLLIPVILFVISGIYKKFIFYAIAILIVLFYFNQGKGLNLTTFFETIFDGLKSIF